MANIKSNAFEDFVFRKSFSILGVLIAGSFGRMFEHFKHCFAIIGDTWRANHFFSLHTIWCLIKTAFLFSIAFSYLFVTGLTILAVTGTMLAIFVVLATIFAFYQVVKGIMIGIVDAFKAYILSLIENTFRA